MAERTPPCSKSEEPVDYSITTYPSELNDRGYRGVPHHRSDSDMVGATTSAPQLDTDRKIIVEFCHLLEKSKQFFNGLRDLPQYGHKQWYAYFGRTFDTYTRLWKFQQQHRDTLDVKYGLQRWQIGEIASKIGQLYYHFYLRTSDTAFLTEAFSFYHAIRGRSYYTHAVNEDRSDLMVKKLRYYARFIVVCLLLKKMKLVRDLIKELDSHILEYGNTYDEPDDQMEWKVVVDEVKSFVTAEPVVIVLNDSYPIILSHRLNVITTPPVERNHFMTLQLQEIVIIGSRSEQVKFSELTMDMYRILQTLERVPAEDQQHLVDISLRSRGLPTMPGAPNANGFIDTGCDNPHKYLLYKPTLSQVLVYMASGCKDLPPNGVLLLYISADGYFGHPPNRRPDDLGYDIGGVITGSRRDLYNDPPKDSKYSPKLKEATCLHPGDLYPFTRRPLFIIMDSENSYVFQTLPRFFGQPLVVLMSPVELSSPFQELQRQGSLFTLFLHSPLTAFCLCCDIPNLSLVEWDRAQVCIERFLAEASKMMTRSRDTDPAYLSMMGDDFLRLLILRYIFCALVLRMHRSFRDQANRPRASPSIPEADVMEHPVLTNIIWDLTAILDVGHHFMEPSSGQYPPAHAAAPAPAASTSTTAAGGPAPPKE